MLGSIQNGLGPYWFYCEAALRPAPLAPRLLLTLKVSKNRYFRFISDNVVLMNKIKLDSLRLPIWCKIKIKLTQAIFQYIVDTSTELANMEAHICIDQKQSDGLSIVQWDTFCAKWIVYMMDIDNFEVQILFGIELHSPLELF